MKHSIIFDHFHIFQLDITLHEIHDHHILYAEQLNPAATA
jgi:hypothetical protein